MCKAIYLQLQMVKDNLWKNEFVRLAKEQGDSSAHFLLNNIEFLNALDAVVLSTTSGASKVNDLKVQFSKASQSWENMYFKKNRLRIIDSIYIDNGSVMVNCGKDCKAFKISSKRQSIKSNDQTYHCWTNYYTHLNIMHCNDMSRMANSLEQFIVNSKKTTVPDVTIVE